MMKQELSDLNKHETKRTATGRFLVALVILIAYIVYLVINYGALGLYLGLITWSAFVLATPLPDGGLILDFPIRLLTNLRMVYSEIIVWIVAITLNIYAFTQTPQIYPKTLITDAFYKIISHPWPNWIIIIVSCAGTFLGLYFGDELMDLVLHKHRKKYQRFKVIYQIVFALFILTGCYLGYRYFLRLFGLQI